MKTWSNQTWIAGTRVRVLECFPNGKTKYLGFGLLVNDYYPNLNENLVSIRMPNGRLISGTECWWVPEEAKVDI